MATASVNGIDIRFEDSGGDGPAVLFSHGFLMDHTMFDPQVEHLAGDYRCIRWDERGFGGTRASGEFTYWDSADDAVGVLDHLGVDQAVFVGMSQGGFLSLRAALAHPDRVRAVVLIDSAADVDDAETLAGYQGMLHVFGHGTDDERNEVFQMVAGLILADEALDAEWIPKWRQIEPEQLTLAGGALLGRDDISGRIGEIGCPILTIHGTADQAIAMDRAEALAAAAQDHRGIVQIEGAAHAPNLTHPDQVNPPLAEFLASL
ncbi:MAG: alpha/beta hydrolase [Ilumatobacter sp.]|uniref:alpha/beta fold hydrolase n=1 Tax=Ilumatobacter sp. TaxID=1967498 RepID=UPI0026260445|nr:alpha/beta hydrolase [Ilumatobacter sp.]MDJ0767589.1 alpha/beta hydrolase [Ilumatobacter sp.]